jgi:hypothetical protein
MLSFVARDLLLDGTFDEFGELLHYGQDLKKQLSSNITNSETDDMYQIARKARKIRKDHVRNSLNRLRELPFHFQECGSRIIFDNGTRYTG